MTEAQNIPVPRELLVDLIGFAQQAADRLKRRRHGAKAAREAIQRVADEATELLDEYAPLEADGPPQSKPCDNLSKK